MDLEIKFQIQFIQIQSLFLFDESYFQPGPRGNAKSDEAKNTTFVRTLPSLINKMKEGLQNKNSSEFYMSQSIRNKPRDKKQCRNMKQAIDKLNH